MTACRPSFFLSSCSGSAAQLKNVTTSFAYWETVPGVPAIVIRKLNSVGACELTIFVFHDIVKECTRHRNGTTREVRVVVQTFADFHSSWRVNVTSYDRENVVLGPSREEVATERRATYRTAMSSLGDQGKVRGKSATVAGTRSLFIRERIGKIVGELSGSCEHFALIVGAVGVLDLFGERSSLLSGIRDPDQVAPGDSVEGMARRANFLVDLVAASDAGKDGERDEKISLRSRSPATGLYTPGVIKSIEPTLMIPWVFGRMEALFAWRVCADCPNKRKGTVKVSVPGNGSSREDGDRGKSSCRRKRRRFLQCARLAVSGSPKNKRETRANLGGG
jgi:hypothetical protein